MQTIPRILALGGVVSVGLFAIVYAGEVGDILAGEKAPKVAEPPKVLVYKNHGPVRQIGYTLASFAAGDVARKIKVGFKYPASSFAGANAEALRAALGKHEVYVAVVLKGGKSYGVMSPKVAKSIGILDYSDIDVLKQFLMGNEKIKIVSKAKNFLGAKDTGTISHWNDAKYSPDKFKKIYGDWKFSVPFGSGIPKPGEQK